MLRFGDDDGNISFEDFIMICIKLKALLGKINMLFNLTLQKKVKINQYLYSEYKLYYFAGIYKGKDPEGKNDVKFTLEEWVENTIYC